ncbi:hypothetical protein K504DRAFT_154637 [Pleomassaria siparia CBS 279.74]|uniref:Galactose oxidase n=1 Tax=Pleomassaria siparia CBS 279.74 TaxID=1314801 RepID=A0A6G1KMR6_9PLEO|nr:hypothetical protein K504DRAFT_154637 [Pleomassaria siparia CBS 279.74]
METSSGGIAVHIGGQRYSNADGDMESMRKVLVYDSGTDTWYGQATTADGDFPPGRTSFCAVAASASDGSSHNIFVYAGESPDSTPSAYSDMWILSIPSFRWIRVDVDSPPRKAHACAAVAEKYMVTYGGIPSGWGEEGDGDACDTDNYGLRLFDMSTLTWTTKYGGPVTGGKKNFAVPKPVYDAVGGDEQGSATQTAPTAGFETTALSTLFQRSNPTSSGISTSSPSPSSTDTNNDNSKKSSNIGPIVGGVVGGLAVAIIVLIAILYLLNRYKKKIHGHSAVPPYEADGQHRYTGEMSADQPAKYAHQAYEIPGDQPMAPQELYADGPYQRPHN